MDIKTKAIWCCINCRGQRRSTRRSRRGRCRAACDAQLFYRTQPRRARSDQTPWLCVPMVCGFEGEACSKEPDDAFIRRINAQAGDRPKYSPNDSGWVLGPRLRHRGSPACRHLEKDPPADPAAARGAVAVYPVGGWWPGKIHRISGVTPKPATQPDCVVARTRRGSAALHGDSNADHPLRSPSKPDHAFKGSRPRHQNRQNSTVVMLLLGGV